MRVHSFLGKLLSEITEESYDKILSDYRLWVGIGAAHGWISDNQLHYDIQAIMRPDRLDPSSGGLIHSSMHLLLRFITDIGLDPNLSAYSFGIRDQLSSESLKRFFEEHRKELCNTGSLYTNANILANLANLGYLNLEDVRDRLLQSLLPPRFVHQLNSLIILFKISGATFAAYVHPSVLDRSFVSLRTNIDANVLEFTGLVKVRGLTLAMKDIHER